MQSKEGKIRYLWCSLAVLMMAIGIISVNRIDAGSRLYDVWLYHKIKSERSDLRKASYIYMTKDRRHEYWMSRLSGLDLPDEFGYSRDAVGTVVKTFEKAENETQDL